MPKKKTPNVDFMVDYVKDFLSGKTERLFFDLDFHHYLSEHYAKMEREYPQFADAFHFYIVECGVDCGDDLSDAQYKKLIRKQFNELLAVEAEGFF